MQSTNKTPLELSSRQANALDVLLNRLNGNQVGKTVKRGQTGGFGKRKNNGIKLRK